jgi:molybdopterin synthase sulfur carrier subunit
MREMTDGAETVEVEGSSVRQIINNLDEKFPGVKARLTDNGKMKANISVAVDGQVSPIGVLEKVGEESEVHFFPAIGGG